MELTKYTLWRQIQPISYDQWKTTLSKAGAPAALTTLESYLAAGDNNLLALGMLRAESSFGTRFTANPRSNNNPFNLKNPDTDDPNDYMKYPNFTAGIRGWHDRLNSKTYGGGVYDKARTIGELIHTFAPSSDGNNEKLYLDNIAEVMNPLLKEVPPVAELVFGKVKHPDFINRDIPNGVNTAWTPVAKRVIRAVVLHRMLGTLWGTDEYFRNEGRNRALTDYGVGVAAQDGAANAGVLLRWNDPRGKEAPWSSGPVSAPYGDGKAFVDRYGVNAVGPDTTAIEISGKTYGVTVDSKALETISQFIAYWADQYHIAWTTFPLIPSEGNRSFVCWHQEFTIGTGKVCPGDVVIRLTPGLISRAQAIMKESQTASTTPVEVKPTLPPLPVQSQIRNQKVFLAYEEELVAVKDSKCWYRAETDSVIIPQLTIAKGKKYKTAYAVESDGTLWFIMADGARVPASVFVGIVENG